jgi:hypothetical protein
VSREWDQLDPESRRRIKEYTDSVLARTPPMTAEQMAKVVALLRPTAARLRAGGDRRAS